MESSRSLSFVAALFWAVLNTTSACSPTEDWVPSGLLDEALAASLVGEARQLNVFPGEFGFWDVEFEILHYYKGSGPEGAVLNVTGFRQSSLCGVEPSDNPESSQGVLFLCLSNRSENNEDALTNAQFELNGINLHTGFSKSADISDLTDGELAVLIGQSGETPTQFGDFTIFGCSDARYLYQDLGTCGVPKAIGGMCRASIPRFTYNSVTGDCEEFTYGGCEGNTNNFETLEECNIACGAPGRPGVVGSPESGVSQQGGAFPKAAPTLSVLAAMTVAALMLDV